MPASAIEIPDAERATKQFMVGSFEIKAKNEKERTFEGYLNTWELDEGNWFWRDKVWPGAFTDWVADFKAEGNPYVPLVDSHDYGSILNIYGHLLEPSEDDKGLYTKWQVIDGPDGDRVFARLKPGSVRKMSMGYTPQKWDFEQEELEDGRQQRNLRKVKVDEGSLVVFAMNDSSEVTRVKALLRMSIDPKTLTEKQRVELKQLHEQISALLTEQKADPDKPEPAVRVAPEVQLALQQRILGLKLRRLVTRV